MPIIPGEGLRQPSGIGNIINHFIPEAFAGLRIPRFTSELNVRVRFIFWTHRMMDWSLVLLEDNRAAGFDRWQLAWTTRQFIAEIGGRRP